MVQGTKKGVKSVDLHSVFNMSQLSMETVHDLGNQADNYSMLCSNLQFRYLIYYYTSLKAIYRYIRPLINKNSQAVYDDRFEDLEGIIYKQVKFTWGTYKILDVLHRDLIQERQYKNLLWSATRDERYAENYFKEEYRSF